MPHLHWYLSYVSVQRQFVSENLVVESEKKKTKKKTRSGWKEPQEFLWRRRERWWDRCVFDTQARSTASTYQCGSFACRPLDLRGSNENCLGDIQHQQLLTMVISPSAAVRAADPYRRHETPLKWRLRPAHNSISVSGTHTQETNTRRLLCLSQT